MNTGRYSRRTFLKAVGATASTWGMAAALASCAPNAQDGAAPSQPEAATVIEPSACDGEMDWSPSYPLFDKYEPPVEISTTAPVVDWHYESDNMTNNPAYNRVVDQLGIEYTVHWEYTGDIYEQKFSADIAAGTLADMFRVGGADLALLVENDALFNIKEIWEETASDLVKEKKGYPDGPMWYPAWSNDRSQLYGIPFTWGPGYNVDNLGHIRKDWLDQLGLDTPTTLEGITETARAFKAAGLCQYGISACQNLSTWYHSLDPVFGAHGVTQGIWQPDGQGGLSYSSLEPGTKDALGYIRAWYEEGLMDPDFFTYSEGEAAGGVGAERVGIFWAPWWIAGNWIRNLYEQLPEAELALFPAPAGPNGAVGRRGSGRTGPVIAFRDDVEPRQVEAAIKHLNWTTEMHVNWEAYQQYGEWRNSSVFNRGYEWDWDEACNVVSGPAWPANTYAYVNTFGMSFPYNCYPDYQADIFADMAKWQEADPTSLNKAQQYIIGQPAVQREIQYYLEVFNTLDIASVNEFEGRLSDDAAPIWTDLTDLEQERFIAIVIGNEPLDAFDTYVEEWWANGGDTVVQEVNAWYAAVRT